MSRSASRLEGTREVLGLWIEKTEGARFWTSVMTELRNRGVKDILFVCTDGLTGFPEAIDAVFPDAVNQTCVVHLVRQSLRYLSWKERKSCAAELRRIYTAADADAARRVLDELTAAWAASTTKTAALQVWERAWDRFIPFLAFPQEIRRVVYTTNTVESLHMQIRKTIKTRGHFPNDDAALRLIWLAIMRAKTNWRSCYNWTKAMAVLRIHSETASPTTPNHPPIHRKTRRLGADELLISYRSDDGLRYPDFQPATPPERLLPEDLAVTILINSRVGPAAFKSVQDSAHTLDLPSPPHKPLEQTSEDERQAAAEVAGSLAKWPGFAALVATKVLHKKRPRLIPILDNQAIFGAYMNARWPEQRSSAESIYAVARIREALD